jgi:hypothetical protein
MTLDTFFVCVLVLHKNYLIDFEADGNGNQYAQEPFKPAEDLVADLFGN